MQELSMPASSGRVDYAARQAGRRAAGAPRPRRLEVAVQHEPVQLDASRPAHRARVGVDVDVDGLEERAVVAEQAKTPSRAKVGARSTSCTDPSLRPMRTRCASSGSTVAETGCDGQRGMASSAQGATKRPSVCLSISTNRFLRRGSPHARGGDCASWRRGRRRLRLATSGAGNLLSNRNALILLTAAGRRGRTAGLTGEAVWRR